MEDEDMFYSLQSAADYAKVTRQAIYFAIKDGQLKAKKVNGLYWNILRKDVDEYRESKYNIEEKRTYEDGTRVFDFDKGFLSVMQASKLLTQILDKPIKTQRIYHMIRSRTIPAFKDRTAWVLRKDDLLKYAEEESARDLAYFA